MSQNPFVLAMAVMLFFGPLVRGLFFAPERLVAAGFIFLMALLWLADRTRKGRPVYRSWTLLEVGALLIPLAYLASTLRAVHAESALLGLLSAAAAYAVFLIAREAPLGGTRGRMLTTAVVLSGVVTSVVGLLAYLVVIRLPGAVTLPWRAEAVAGRVGSTFQYYNSLAAYLGAALMLALGSQTAEGDWWRNAPWRAAAGLMSLVLALTQSRGALVLLPVAAAFFVVLSPRGRRLASLAEVVGVGLGASMTLAPLTQAARSGDVLVALAWAAVAAAVAAGPWGTLTKPLHRLRLGGPLRFLAQAGAAVVLIGLVGAAVRSSDLLQTPVAVRVTTSAEAALDAAQGELAPPRDQVERWLYLKDAWRMLQDRPLGGGGGGAWASLFPSYRSLPYYTTEPHSYYAQVAVEAGLLGLVALAVFLAGLVISAVRLLRVRRGGAERLRLAGGIAALLLLLSHAAVDFDLSFLAISIVVWVLVGSLHGEVRRLSAEELEGDAEGALRRFLTGVARRRELGVHVAQELAAGGVRLKRGSWSTLALVAGFLILGMITVPLLGSEVFKYRAAVQRDTGRPESAVRNYLRALRLSPRDDEAALALSAIYLQQATALKVTDPLATQRQQESLDDATRMAERASNLNPASPLVRAALARTYLQAGRAGSALAVGKQLQDENPWGLDGYEVAARAEVELGLSALKAGDAEEARTRFGDAVQEGINLLTMASRFDQMPVRVGVRPQVNGRLALAIGQSYYFLGFPKEAEAYLLKARWPSDVTPEAESWLALLYGKTGEKGKYNAYARRPWVRQALQDEEFLALASLTLSKPAGDPQ